MLMVGVVIGWWILDKYGIKSAKKTTPMLESSMQEIVDNLPTQIMPDNKGEKVEAVAVDGGIVERWNPDTGEIEFLREDKLWKLTVDPTQATVFVPSKTVKAGVILIADKSNPHWKSAFCKGDYVSIRMSENKVIFIDNGGYRACGFRE